MEQLLLIIDMQNGFVNEETRHIIPKIKMLINYFREKKQPIAFTRFINNPDSCHVRWINWSRFLAEPEISLIDDFRDISAEIFDKNGYTAFTESFETFIQDQTIDEIILCGIATDGCILKTAVDAFEKKIRPIVVEDACASHAGDDIHRAGLLLISRFVGKRQIMITDDVIG